MNDDNNNSNSELGTEEKPTQHSVRCEFARFLKFIFFMLFPLLPLFGGYFLSFITKNVFIVWFFICLMAVMTIKYQIKLFPKINEDTEKQKKDREKGIFVASVYDESSWSIFLSIIFYSMFFMVPLTVEKSLVIDSFLKITGIR